MNNKKLIGITLIIYQIFIFIIAPIDSKYFFVKFLTINLDPILIIAGLLIGYFLINEKKETFAILIVIAVVIALLLIPFGDSQEKVSGFFLRVDAVLIWSYLGYIFKETINNNKKNEPKEKNLEKEILLQSGLTEKETEAILKKKNRRLINLK